MDIVLRVSDSALEHFLRDKATAALAWWTFGKRPQSVYADDRIWFVNKNRVFASAPVFEITNEDLNCDTGRTWRGWHITWRGGHTTVIYDPPLDVQLESVPTRGFRYVRDRVERNKLLAATRGRESKETE